LAITPRISSAEKARQGSVNVPEAHAQLVELTLPRLVTIDAVFQRPDTLLSPVNKHNEGRHLSLLGRVHADATPVVSRGSSLGSQTRDHATEAAGVA
jgi:hypothetical protein